MLKLDKHLYRTMNHFIVGALLLGANLTVVACDTPSKVLCGPDSDKAGMIIQGPEVNCGQLNLNLPKLEDTTLYTCYGEEQSIMDIVSNHDVTYITFGAQWCTACQEEVAIINTKIVDHFDMDKVGAIQILIENFNDEPPTTDVCQSWANSLKPKFTLLTDLDQATLPLYFEEGISTLPLHFIVTRDGTIQYDKLGAIPDNLQDLIGQWVETP